MDELIALEGHYEARIIIVGEAPREGHVLKAYNPVTLWSEAVARLNRLSGTDQAKAYAAVYDVDENYNEWLVGNIYAACYLGQKEQELTLEDVRRM